MKKIFTLLCLAVIAMAGLKASAAGAWLIGNDNFGGWNYSGSLELTTDDNNIYYAVVEAKVGNYFSFLDSNAATSWDDLNGGTHRFGPATSGATPTGDWEATSNGDKSYRIATAGTYKCEFRLSDKKVRVTLQEEAPPVEFDADKLTFVATGEAIGGWNMPPTVIFEKQADDSHVAFVEAAQADFKLAGVTEPDGLDWSGFDVGVYGTTEALVEGENTLTAGVTTNMTMPIDGYVTLTVKNVTETSCVLVIEKTGEIEKPDPKEPAGVFILGNVDGATGWSPAVGHELTSTDNVVYSGTVEVCDAYEGKGWIGFTRNLADFDDELGWGQIAAIRFGVEGETENEVVEAENFGNAYNVKYGVTRSFELAAGFYDITVDLNAMTVTFAAGQEPDPELYILGQVAPVDGWYANQGVPMTLVEGKKFTAELVATGSVEGKSYFSFATALATADDDWDAIASKRYGAADVKGSENDYVLDDTDFDAELSLTKSGTPIAFCIAAGNYTVTVDLDALTVVIAKAAEGNVLDVNNDDTVNAADVNVVIAEILAHPDGDGDKKFDVNGDDKVNAADANVILAYILEHV